ncbi:MAG: tetratricopeptide repeat protein [Planctomycetota bacterium]
MDRHTLLRLTSGILLLAGLALGGCRGQTSKPSDSNAAPAATQAAGFGADDAVLKDVDVSKLGYGLRVKLGAARSAVRAAPDEADRLAELGAIYHVHGYPDQAILCMRRATELQADEPRWWYWLGAALEKADRKPEASAAYEKVIELWPNHGLAQARLAALRGDTSPLPAETQPSPRYNVELLERGYHIASLRDRALWLARTKRASDAKRYADVLAEVDEDGCATHFVLGHAELCALTPEGTDNAIREFKQAIATPEGARFMPAKESLGLSLVLQRDYTAAEPYLREVVDADPNSLPAVNGLAWILATHPDATRRKPEEAVRLAERLCAQPENRTDAYLDTLAAAYAAAGRMDDAKKAIDDAIALLSRDDAGARRTADNYRQRRALYAAGQPYVATAAK